MKLLLISILMFASINWEPDFNNAKKLARENDKLILLNFSGSDWCVPCIQLRNDFFENSGFSPFADKRLILVNADFPRKKKNQQSAEQVSRNDALAEKYNKEGVFPLTLLLDAEGNVLKTWKGKPDGDLNSWISEIESAHKKHYGL